MTTPHLVISPATEQAIKALEIKANLSPFRYPTLYKAARARQTIGHRLNVPHGYAITYSVGHFRPGWVCRHLTVAGPGRWPLVKDTRYLAKSFGFRSDLEECLTWPDGPPARRSVHILEPLTGDWSPLRSS